MIVLKDYTIKEQNGIYYIITSSTPNCPDCGGELKTRDSKKRKLISSDGTVNTFALRRYKSEGVDGSRWNSRISWFRISIIRDQRS